MHKNFILALSLVIFLSVFTKAGGVTNIKEVVNNSTKKVVKLTTYERKNGIWEGAPRKTTGVITYSDYWDGDMWIPWADNEEQFKEHFMTIEIIELRPTRGTDIYHTYFVYQTGEYVRVSFYGITEHRGSGSVTGSSYDPDAKRVPGEWRSGGERRIVFDDEKDGSVSFKFEKINQ